MNISTDYQEEKPFPNKPSGGYEWWYFDAISADEAWSFVVIFYQGNPFSPNYIQKIKKNNGLPEQYPAVSISLYNREKTEFYSFLEYKQDDFNWNEETNELKIGSHSFKRSNNENELIYSVYLDQKLSSDHLLKGEIEFRSLITNAKLFEKNRGAVEQHFWNLIQPKANVSGSLALNGKSVNHSIDFEGIGYHDHNVGLEPMKNDFEDWYWGRFHFKESTLIYYVMNRKNKKQYKAWLISDDNQSILEQFDSVELDGIQTNLFGIKSARKLVLKSPKTEVTIQSALPIDNGPFYQRFKSQAIMLREDEISTANGITEYIFPENIYKKRFWPAVRMRLRFVNEKPHWVQKFKRFYEWTW